MTQYELHENKESGEKYPAQTALFEHLYHYDPQGFPTHNLSSMMMKNPSNEGGKSVYLRWRQR